MASVKGFFDGLAKLLAKAAMLAASHPQVIIDVVTAAATKNVAPLEQIPGDLSK